MSEKEKNIALPNAAGQLEAISVVERKLNLNETTQAAKRLVYEAGEKIRPFGNSQLGFVVCFFFQDTLSTASGPVFNTAVQTFLADVPEVLAPLGLERMQSAMMEAYGKKPPAVRQDFKGRK